MKILLLSNMYPSEAAPNYGVFVQRTEQLLIQAGHEVKRVVLSKQTSRIRKLAGYAGYVAKLFKETTAFKPDVLYVHYASQNAKPVLWLKKRYPNLRVVLNVHGTDVLPQTAAQAKYQPDVASMMKVIDHVVVPSSFYEDTVKEKYGYKGEVTVFPSGGIDTTVFYPDAKSGKAFRKQNSIAEEAFMVGYISRIDTGKGWDTLIEALKMSKVPNIHVVFAGTGAEESAFQEKAKELTIPFTKLPMLTQPQMNAAFNAMDVFCFPSSQESLGLVGIEAMATATPIIVSNIPGVKDYATTNNAWFFEVGDSGQLAAHIETAAKEPLDSYQAEALKTAEAFDQHRVKNMLLQVFNSRNDKKEASHI